jgi:drug/metabolite transporter (DMT)-like permease
MSAVAAVASGGLGTLAVPLGEPALLAALVLLGIFAGAVPSILLLAGIRRLGGVRSGILMLAEPVVGVALAAALLHEAILPIQVLGGAAILIGAALAQRGSPARSEQAGRVIEGAAPRLPEPTPPVAAAGLGLEDEVDAAVALHVPGGP